MKPKFEFSGVVERKVRDTVSLDVRADTIEEAERAAFHALSKYPEPFEQIEGTDVSFMYINERKTRTVEIIDLSEKEQEEGIA